MGFGFNLFFFPTLCILLFLLAIVLILSKDDADIDGVKLLKWGCLGGLGVFILLPLAGSLLSPLWTKIEIDPKDIVGTYVVDRNMFQGPQADWQYNHYRFEVKKDQRFMFYLTEGETIVKTYTGQVNYHNPYGSTRISIKMDSTSHHVIDPLPTTYRRVWSFYYVFESERYGNMFFRKGKWKALN